MILEWKVGNVASKMISYCVHSSPAGIICIKFNLPLRPETQQRALYKRELVEVSASPIDLDDTALLIFLNRLRKIKGKSVATPYEVPWPPH